MEKKKFEYDYPHPAVTVDCVIFGFDGNNLNILLILRGIEPFKNEWALPGGFVRIDETVEEAAVRELFEETHVRCGYMKQIGVFSTVDRDPRERVITVAFFALVRPDEHEIQGGDDAVKAQWWNVKKLPKLAFDHEKIVQEAMKQLQLFFENYNLGFELLDNKFTLSQLQRINELVLDEEIDRRNFYKKINSIEYVNKLEETSNASLHRPATLYSVEETIYENNVLSKLSFFKIDFNDK